MKIKLSANIKLYPRAGKQQIIESLAEKYVKTVNRYIQTYWKLSKQEISKPYPPAKLRAHGSKLENLASLKAWQIVKGAKATGQEKAPRFKKKMFEMDETLAYVIPNFQTKEFDIWLKIYSGVKGRRIAVPGKKHRRLNYWLSQGAKVAKSFKFWKYRGEWYATLFLVLETEEPKPNKVIGIDIDYKTGAVLSTGEKLFDEAEFESLRKRTKWRRYRTKYHRGVNPLRQLYNRAARELLKKHQNTAFAFEKLNFKGKRNRTRGFRRNYKNLPYMQLYHALSYLAPLGGSLTVQVGAKNTSITCPVCGNVDKHNRRSEDLFVCTTCGFTAQADYVAALNIAHRAGRKLSLPVLGREYAEGSGILPHQTQPGAHLPVEAATTQSRPGATSAPAILHAPLVRWS